MQEIVCDTNIWYGLGRGDLTKPPGVKLYATWINIIEIGFTHPKTKKYFDESAFTNAAKAIDQYADEIIELDPFNFASFHFGLDLPIKKKSIAKTLEAIINNGQPDDDTFAQHNNTYRLFMNLKNDFAIHLNAKKKDIRSESIPSSDKKKEFKKSDASLLKYNTYALFKDINELLSREYNGILVFENDKDMFDSFDMVQNKFELYLNTKQKFFKKWVLEKEMKVSPNDYFDMLNLLYVIKPTLLWTKEKRWKTTIKDAGMNSYLFEY